LILLFFVIHYNRRGKTMATKAEKKAEDWMTTKWRPMMAITYMAINICDFILFPILWSAIQFFETQAANDAFRQWEPLTLQGGAFIHMAFGAILGIAAYTRGQEKIAQAKSEE
jgi:ABC-type phosphate transport system permease subunit